MGGQQDSSSRILEVVGRLEALRTQRTARSGSILSWAVSAARSLKDAFDEYVSKEILEMEEILTMLSSLSQEVDDERSEVKELEGRYEAINEKLNNIIDAANRGKVKRIEFTESPHELFTMPRGARVQEQEPRETESVDIRTVTEAFGIVGETEKLRGRVDRLARNYTRGIGDVESVLDALLRRRGITSNP
ncbi:MAG: hypothetical protein QW057_07340 [Candidatus Bathyarchaeia archaeon]